jgi:hypothetical protein
MAQWVQMNTTGDPSVFSPSAHTKQDLTVKKIKLINCIGHLVQCRNITSKARFVTINMIITFIILFIACWRRGFDPGNQLPNAECKLYARSSPIITPARNINN